MNASAQSGQQAVAAQTNRLVEDAGGGPRTGGQARTPLPVRDPARGKLSCEQWLKQELGAIIDELDLSELQKRCLRSRWLDAVTWMEGKANASQRRYYLLRLTMSGPYAQAGSHGAAYPSFAAQVEAIVQSDVATYVAEIVREKQERKD